MLTFFQGSFTLQLSPWISHTFTRFTPTAWNANQAASNSTAQNTNTDLTYTDPNLLLTKQLFKYFSLPKERNATNRAA